MAASLPERPLVLGGCCCSHVGAIEALSARFDRLALVWLDAHGDLNTPETSPSGNQWGMPLRMVLDAGSVRIEDTVLLGARNLDPPEEVFIRESGLATGAEAIDGALDGADAVYVAFDADVMDPDELPSFMPEPGGWSVDEAEQVSALRRGAVHGRGRGADRRHARSGRHPAAGEARRSAWSLSRLLALFLVTLAIPAASPAARPRAAARAAGRPADRAELPGHRRAPVRAGRASRAEGGRRDPLRRQRRVASAAAHADGGAAQCRRLPARRRRPGGRRREDPAVGPARVLGAGAGGRGHGGPRRQTSRRSRCAEPGSTSASRRWLTCRVSPGSALASRSFSSDPKRASTAVAAAVAGWRAGGVAADGEALSGPRSRHREHGRRDGHDQAWSREAHGSVDLPPFAAAIRAGVPLVMVSHARYTALDRQRIASQSRRDHPRASCATGSASAAS